MAKCDICETDMLKVASCLDRNYFIDGKEVPALRYIDLYGEGARCHDCNCAEGEFHHLGCDMERCPSCRGQFISCDCNVSDEIAVFPKGR